MCDLNTKSEGMMFLFPHQGLQVIDLQAVTGLPSPLLYPPHHRRLDRPGRAEGEAGAAGFTPVLPERPALFNHFVFYRADPRTGAS